MKQRGIISVLRIEREVASGFIVKAFIGVR
jgi:hypothetical protein